MTYLCGLQKDPNMQLHVLSGTLSLALASLHNLSYKSPSRQPGQCRTHVAAAVHIPELVQMRFDGLQVLLLHVAEQALDSQGGHLQGGGGIHGCVLTSCAALRGGE